MGVLSRTSLVFLDGLHQIRSNKDGKVAVAEVIGDDGVPREAHGDPDGSPEERIAFDVRPVANAVGAGNKRRVAGVFPRFSSSSWSWPGKVEPLAEGREELVAVGAEEVLVVEGHAVGVELGTGFFEVHLDVVVLLGLGPRKRKGLRLGHHDYRVVIIALMMTMAGVGRRGATLLVVPEAEGRNGRHGNEPFEVIDSNEVDVQDPLLTGVPQQGFQRQLAEHRPGPGDDGLAMDAGAGKLVVHEFESDCPGLVLLTLKLRIDVPDIFKVLDDVQRQVLRRPLRDNVRVELFAARHDSGHLREELRVLDEPRTSGPRLRQHHEPPGGLATTTAVNSRQHAAAEQRGGHEPQHRRGPFLFGQPLSLPTALERESIAEASDLSDVLGKIANDNGSCCWVVPDAAIDGEAVDDEVLRGVDERGDGAGGSDSGIDSDV